MKDLTKAKGHGIIGKEVDGMTKKAAKNQKKKPGYRLCAICSRDSTKISKFIRHHLRYDGPSGGEIVADLCYGCHSRLHGRLCYNHPFEKIYGKDLGPYMFANSVYWLYRWAWGGRAIDAVVVEMGLKDIDGVEKSERV